MNTGNYGKVRVTEEIQYEYWDCTQCGQKHIRGDNQKCTACGKIRDKDTVFYADGEERVTDPEQLKRFKAGKDRVCEYCQSLIPANEPKCLACAASTSKTEYSAPKPKKQQVIVEVTRASKAVPYMVVDVDDNIVEDTRSQWKARQTMSNVTSSGAVRQEIHRTKHGLHPLAFIAALLFALGLTAFLFWAFSTHEVQYKVMHVEWTREADVERYVWSEHTDWQDEMKGDNIQIASSSREVRSHRQVLDGYHSETYYDTERYKSGSHEDCTSHFESLGNGARKKVTSCRDVPEYSTRRVAKTRRVADYHSEPVYDTKCIYRSQAYAFLKTLKEHALDNSPQWPVLPLDPEATDQAHPDRIGARRETYLAFLLKTSSGKGPDEATVQTTENLLRTFYHQGETKPFRVNNLGILQLQEGERVQ